MRYRFGEVELDSVSHELRRAGEPVQLWPKVFDLLRYLVERRGELVTKEELLDAVWPDSHVAEGSVAWTISHARRAIGQRGSAKQPIETVHKRGYRFTAEVEVASAPAARSPALERGPALPPFVGRDAVMQALDARLRAAESAGRGDLCVLVGPPGIGKTRCMDELGARAARTGFDVWSARCVEHTWAPAFWPWVQVLREASRTRPAFAERAGTLLARWEGAGSAGEKGDDATAATDANFWWFDGVSRLLLDAATARPIAILLDDLQWADAASVDLLAFLAPELRRVPIVVIATQRDDAASMHAPAAKRLARHASRIDLAPLTEDDVASYLRAVAASDAFRADTLAALHRATAGNPLFLEHTVQALLARPGRVPLATLPPDAIEPARIARDTLGASLERLDEKAQALLAVASVLGERFGLSELEAISALDPEELLARLDPALREGLVVAEDPSTLRFCHALIRTVLYDALAAGRRVTLHRRAAEALEHADATRLGEIAYHHHRSLTLGDHARVAAAAERAARAASRMQAFADAARFAGWALEAQALERGVPPRARADLLLFYAQMLAGADDEPTARESVATAVTLARAHGLYDLLVRAARILRPTYMMGGLADPFAQTILEEALAHAPSGANDLRINALSQLAWMPPYALDADKSKAMSFEALELARAIGDETLLLRALNARLHALGGPDDCDALLAAAAEMQAHDSLPRAWVTAAVFGARCGAQLHRAEMDAAQATRAELGRLARAHQWPAVLWFHERLVVHDDILGGRFAAAEDGLEALRAHGERWRVPFATDLHLVLHGLVTLETRGVLALAEVAPRSMLRSSLDRAPVGMRPLLARLALALGDRDLARRVLDAAAENDFAGVPRDLGYLGSLASLGVLAIRLDDRPRARRLYDLLAPYPSFNTPNALLLYEGSVSHFLGMLGAYLGMGDEVTVHFEAALAMNERIGQRPQLARTCVEYAAWMNRGTAATRAKAGELLHRARTMAEEMGMGGLRVVLERE